MHWLGFVPEATLDAVLASATGLVFPSLFEGWGMPVTDALAVGLPVACSDLPVLREVAGVGADYFDPTDPAAIAAAIARLARPGRRDVGPATSAMSLSWDEAAHRLVALQRWAAGRSVLDHDHTALLAGFVDGGHDEVPPRVGGAGRDRIAGRVNRAGCSTPSRPVPGAGTAGSRTHAPADPARRRYCR